MPTAEQVTSDLELELVAADNPAFSAIHSHQNQPTAEMAKPVWQGNHPVGQIKAQRPLYRFCATGLGAAMWFFLMYRARKDGAALLGWKHPWDH